MFSLLFINALDLDFLAGLTGIISERCAVLELPLKELAFIGFQKTIQGAYLVWDIILKKL